MEPEQKRVYLSSSNGSVFARHPTDSGLSFASLKYHLKTKLNIDHSSNYRLIEIGCGYGRMTTLIASYYRLFEVVGTDINPEFIELAKRQERDRRQGISYHVCDAGLKIEEEFCNFDISVSINVLQNCAYDKNILFNFCQSHFDSLKPGGICLIIFGPSSSSFFQRQLNTYRSGNQNGFRCIGKSYAFREEDEEIYDGIAYQSVFINANEINKLWNNYFWSYDIILEALESAGFIDIELVPHLLGKNLQQHNNGGEEEDVSLSKTFIECRKPI